MRERADNRQAEPVQAVKCARSIHGCSLARLPLCSFLFFAQQHMMQPAESCSTLTHTHTHRAADSFVLQPRVGGCGRLRLLVNS